MHQNYSNECLIYNTVDVLLIKQKAAISHNGKSYKNIALDSINLIENNVGEVKSDGMLISPKIIRHIDQFLPLIISDTSNISAFTYLGEKFTFHKQDKAVLFFKSPNNNTSFKIEYSYAPTGIYTVLGEKKKNTLLPITTANGHSVTFIKKGVCTKEAMLKSLFTSNTIKTWAIRIIGFFLLFFGTKKMLFYLTSILERLLFLGNFIKTAKNFVAFIIALVLSFITISIAWVFNRPLYLIILIILATCVIMYSKHQLKRQIL